MTLGVGSAGEPLIRVASRVLVIDERDRLLLFRTGLVEWDREQQYWFAPGGGVEAGESLEQAARRELWEETGLTDVELSPQVWRRVIDFEAARQRRFHEHFFVARAESFEPKPASPQADEEWMTGDDWYRWWSLDLIRQHEGPERIVPRRLASLLPPILAGDYPAVALELTE